jgi:hypothetical protein
MALGAGTGFLRFSDFCFFFVFETGTQATPLPRFHPFSTGSRICAVRPCCSRVRLRTRRKNCYKTRACPKRAVRAPRARTRFFSLRTRPRGTSTPTAVSHITTPLARTYPSLLGVQCQSRAGGGALRRRRRVPKTCPRQRAGSARRPHKAPPPSTRSAPRKQPAPPRRVIYPGAHCPSAALHAAALMCCAITKSCLRARCRNQRRAPRRPRAPPLCNKIPLCARAARSGHAQPARRGADPTEPRGPCAGGRFSQRREMRCGGRAGPARRRARKKRPPPDAQGPGLSAGAARGAQASGRARAARGNQLENRKGCFQ